jgi:DNA polymerase III alpha subunit (gram-positive type)
MKQKAQEYADIFNQKWKAWEFDFLILPQGIKEVRRHLKKLESVLGADHPKVKKTRQALFLAEECEALGIRFLWPDKEKSHPDLFLEEEGNIRLPF